ncbi:MAG: hypothetical protein ACRDRZ_11915, partial [Pseudonocardiaceae bacterium]
MSSDVIYTVSDLNRKRREVADAARRGLARIRDTDGTGLVLLPARHYEVLEAVSRWADRLGVVERAQTKSRAERQPADFGDLTWLRHLDDEDLAQFVTELRQTLSLAYHDEDLTSLDNAVVDWKATAEELADPARREILLGTADAARDRPMRSPCSEPVGEPR